MPSGNPVLREKAFQGLPVTGERMTMNGTVTRTALLLVLAVITGGWTWQRFADVAAGGNLDAALAAISPFMWGGLLVGLVLALVTTFAQRWAGITAPLYAIAEGFALGGISAVMNLRFPGIVLQAVMLTVGVLAVMLLAYRSGLIKVTDKFRMGVVAATGGIALLYVVDMALRAFTHIQIPFIHETGAIGIGFSLLVVGLAALNLVLDFDMIDRATKAGAPKYMEWYGAFALMVTLVWLYMELLRLLSKARR
ncbi:Bax inhibitor-1/YccA family protein [Dyella nitratireducens]|uniref:Membrane protein n=1 Tax=Dyella nitratireducens TaxID=1849580 RepID=A0ABQ1GMJ8_9GAMM|nr:Bax inhibitor-1/YccA family protein [Dyella nitratireducens]GGA46824.1 membrane protein [Dyella nitratireducens]GLQ41502.1 membrane protein [Dyella nitratireducens]